jgi:hypothetical protein
MTDIRITPGYIHFNCNECLQEIEVPINFVAAKRYTDEKGSYVIEITAGNIDNQVIFDHQFQYHLNLFDIE